MPDHIIFPDGPATTVSCNMDDALRRDLNTIAREYDTTIGALVRYAIDKVWGDHIEAARLADQQRSEAFKNVRRPGA